MNKTFWDFAFKVLSALVIPLILWGVSLEVRLAVSDTEMERLQTDVKEAQAIKDMVVANTNTAGRMEEKLNAAADNLREIKTLVTDFAKHDHRR